MFSTAPELAAISTWAAVSGWWTAAADDGFAWVGNTTAVWCTADDVCSRGSVGRGSGLRRGSRLHGATAADTRTDDDDGGDELFVLIYKHRYGMVYVVV